MSRGRLHKSERGGGGKEYALAPREARATATAAAAAALTTSTTTKTITYTACHPNHASSVLTFFDYEATAHHENYTVSSCPSAGCACLRVIWY